MKENRKAYASLCSAMLIFGTIAIFRRNIPFSSGLLAFSRGLLGGVFLLIFVAVKHHRMEKVEKKQLALLILSGAIIGVDWILLFEAYNCTTVAVATMCFYMQPTDRDPALAGPFPRKAQRKEGALRARGDPRHGVRLRRGGGRAARRAGREGHCLRSGRGGCSMPRP